MILIAQNNKPRSQHSNKPSGGSGGSNFSSFIPKADSTRTMASMIPYKMIKQDESDNLDPSSLIAWDHGTSYFQDDHLSARSYSVCNATKFDSTVPPTGWVRIKCLLNDLVSGSLAPPSGNDSRQNESMSASIPRNNLGRITGAIPNRHITPSAGVNGSRSDKVLIGSFEETSEPWSDRGDSTLLECFKRYGMNWQLAAKALSSNAIAVPIIIPDDQRYLPGNAKRRSPADCHHRWRALNAATRFRVASVPHQKDKAAGVHTDTSIESSDYICFVFRW